jgi:hypothetical protein
VRNKLSANGGKDNVVGLGHCCSQHFVIGGCIGEDDVESDYFSAGLAQVMDGLRMKASWPICPATIDFKGIVIDPSNNDVRRGWF